MVWPRSAIAACPASGPCTFEPTRNAGCAAAPAANTGLLHLRLRFGDAPAARACAVVDTGSTGIVLSARYLKGATLVRAERQPATPRYTSSGNTYSGFWVTASDLSVSDPLGNMRTIPKIDLFCATDGSSTQCACEADSTCPRVSMMGVGFGALPYYTPDYNAFLQIAATAAESSPGTCMGYAVENGGRQIRVGLSEAEPGYAMAKLPPKSAVAGGGGCATGAATWAWDWSRPTATATATLGSDTFQQQTSLLIDSGIVYMILSNRDPRPAAFQPQGQSRFVGGVTVRTVLPGISGPALDYVFTTGPSAAPNVSAPPPAPAYARWGRPGAGGAGVINTGNQILVAWDYLYDYSRGLNGFRRNGG